MTGADCRLLSRNQVRDKQGRAVGPGGGAQIAGAWARGCDGGGGVGLEAAAGTLPQFPATLCSAQI